MMKRRSFLRGIVAAVATKALPLPKVKGALKGWVSPPTSLFGSAKKLNSVTLRFAGQLASDMTYLVIGSRAWKEIESWKK